MSSDKEFHTLTIRVEKSSIYAMACCTLGMTFFTMSSCDTSGSWNIKFDGYYEQQSWLTESIPLTILEVWIDYVCSLSSVVQGRKL